MTDSRKSLTLHLGSIDRVTGWTGAHSDEPPSTVRATTPGTKQTAGRNSPIVLTCSKAGRMPITKHRTGVLLDFKADSKGRIAGYGSTFGGEPDSYGDVIAPGAFAESLRREPLPKMLWQHDRTVPIGRWTSAYEDSVGLFVEGVLNLKTTAGKDAYEHLAAGDVNGLSIGYSEVRATPNRSYRLLQELTLYEVSVVTTPANSAATVTTVKNVGSKSELVDLLRGAGLAKTAAARVAAGGWPALAGADHSKAAELAEIIDRATAQIRGL